MTGIIPRWEVTVTLTDYDSILTLISSNSPSSIPQLVMINNSTFTTSLTRLSGEDSMPLMSRIVVNCVSAVLNGTVVNCFEGLSSTYFVCKLFSPLLLHYVLFIALQVHLASIIFDALLNAI